MTTGRSYEPLAAQTGSSSVCSITVALSFITSTSALLNDTTASGSYPAFRTSVRIVILSIRRDGFPALSTHTATY